MSISDKVITDHIQKYTAELRHTDRRHWPKYLFHTTQVENAVEIVASGALNSRNTAGLNFVDVANHGALNANTQTHDYARLYFRPRNGFHYRTEGIKTRSDPYRLDNQMSVPVTLIFHKGPILKRPDVCFSDRNIQSSLCFMRGDEDFSKLDFSKIYHDSSMYGLNSEERDEIKTCRQAEVCLPGNIGLNENLKGIIFRTVYDKLTFDYMLKEKGLTNPHPVKVDTGGGAIYLRKGMYINKISVIGDEISLRMHFPSNAQQDSYLFRIQQLSGKKLSFHGEVNLGGAEVLRVTNFENLGTCSWNIEIENVLAFRGQVIAEANEIA